MTWQKVNAMRFVNIGADVWVNPLKVRAIGADADGTTYVHIGEPQALVSSLPARELVDQLSGWKVSPELVEFLDRARRTRMSPDELRIALTEAVEADLDREDGAGG